MAIAVVQSKAADTATLTITSPTANNTLAVFIVQTGATSAPVGGDNLGASGWTLNSASAATNTASSLVWFATKKAVGTETTLSPTAASGGTIQSITYWELSGISTVYYDGSPVARNAIASATSAASGSVSTTLASDIILAAANFGANKDGGTSAWTGTGPMTLPTGVSGNSRQMIGGSYIPGATLSSVTFTANWTTARASGMLVVALSASPLSSGSGYILSTM